MVKEEAPVTEAQPVFESVTYEAPKVNLLPPEIAERRQLRRIQAGLLAGVVAVAGIVGVLYFQAGNGKAAAQQRLDSAQSQQTRLQAATARLSYVSAQKAQIDAARASLKTAMGSEVLWSKTLDQLRLRLPDGVRYATIGVSRIDPVAGAASTTVGKATAGASTAAGTAIASNIIGIVSFSGTAVDMNAVAAELDQLAKVPGLTDVYLTTVGKPKADATKASLATFTATANLTNSLLSHRYDSLTGGSK